MFDNSYQRHHIAAILYCFDVKCHNPEGTVSVAEYTGFALVITCRLISINSTVKEVSDIEKTLSTKDWTFNSEYFFNFLKE